MPTKNMAASDMPADLLDVLGIGARRGGRGDDRAAVAGAGDDAGANDGARGGGGDAPGRDDAAAALLQMLEGGEVQLRHAEGDAGRVGDRAGAFVSQNDGGGFDDL